jgi:hypothetical protein
MAIDPVYEQSVKAWVAYPRIVHNCPACTMPGIDVKPIVLLQSRNPADPPLAVVPVACTACGCIRLFSADMMSLP